MPKNNFFNYTNERTDFLYYLLSFAMEKYQNEDPVLSDCARELIRYILGMKETESIVSVRFDTDAVPGYEHYMTAVVINDNQFILIGGSDLFLRSRIWKRTAGIGISYITILLLILPGSSRRVGMSCIFP